MSFLVDTHCHLLAGLDDGPGTDEEALEMCQLAWKEGTRMVAATAHLGEQWPAVTVERIREAAQALSDQLQRQRIPLTVRPTAEVMICPGLEELWDQGRLLGMAGQRKYMLTELPGGVFWDFAPLVEELVQRGVRPILAHPERHPELLHDRSTIDKLIAAGCVIQVASDSVAEPLTAKDEQAMRRWICDGVVHLVGSDGHSPHRRPPHMTAAHRRITAWAGAGVADRLCGLNGLMVLEGLPLRTPKPRRARRPWFWRLWPRRKASQRSPLK